MTTIYEMARACGEWLRSNPDEQTTAMVEEAFARGHSDATSAEKVAAIAPTIGADFGQDGRVILTGTPWPGEPHECRREVEIELRGLLAQGLILDELEYISGAPLLGPRVVPCIRHKLTQARLVDFPPTSYGWRVSRNKDAIAGHAARFWEEPMPATPPTLREWLGDRVYELGRWADVLREQPVPVGWITSWRYDERGTWSANGGIGYAQEMLVHLAQGYHLSAKHDAMFSAFFTRHPDVEPDPRPAVIVCEDQYEVLP